MRLRIEGSERSSRLDGFEFNPETASLAFDGLDANAAAHTLDALADQGQADARATKALGVQTREQVPDLFPVARGDADAVIFDPDAHATVGAGFGAHVNAGLALAVDE